MISVEVGKEIVVTCPPSDMVAWAKREMSLDNPEYYKKLQMGKWTGGTPQKIDLFKTVGNDLILPFGCLMDVYRRIPDANYSLHIAPIKAFSYDSNIKLYDYQEEAVKRALKRKNGVLVMPCGSGKTQSGLEVIARVGGRALWLTHTADLLNQSKERALSVLNCDKSAFGMITGGKVNISNGITFATVQTMAKLDLSQYEWMWDVIIVDECQHCAGTPTRVTQFYHVMSSLSARYKIGLTATPHRADGLERSMFALLGGIIHEVSKAEVAHTTCPVEVAVKKTGYVPDMNQALAGDGTINYSGLVQDLVENEERFRFVLNEVLQAAKDGPTLVLANRVEYLQRLSQAFDEAIAYEDFEPSMCISGLGQSKREKKLRKNALTALNDGEIKCLFATYQLAKEGLDVPNLRYVVLATPEKDQTTVMQSAGRVGRKAEGKDHGTVIDFEDDFAMYRGWLKKRLGYYKKLDYKLLT